jgi:hypothetical protein
MFLAQPWAPRALPVTPELAAARRRAAVRSHCAAASAGPQSAAAELEAEASSLSARLSALGVPLKRQRLVVLGPLSDTRCVGLFGDALAGKLSDALQGEGGAAEERRLRRGLQYLSDLLDEKTDEEDMYAAAAAKAEQPGNLLTDGSPTRGAARAFVQRSSRAARSRAGILVAGADQRGCGGHTGQCVVVHAHVGLRPCSGYSGTTAVVR